MYSVFINFSNHISSQWDSFQIQEAEKYGQIYDMAFPNIDPMGDEAYIQQLAQKYVSMILELNPKAVLCQGEFCFTFQVVTLLKEKNIVVLAACSKRMVIEENGKKIVQFVFEQFRKY